MKKLLLIVLFGSLAIQLVSSQGSRTTWAANPNAGLGRMTTTPADFTDYQINMAIAQVHGARTENEAAYAAAQVYSPVMDMADAVQQALETKVRQLRTPANWAHPIPPPLPFNFDPMTLVMGAYYGTLDRNAPQTKASNVPPRSGPPFGMGPMPGPPGPAMGPPTSIRRGGRPGPGPGMGAGIYSPWEPTQWELDMAVHDINMATTEAGAVKAAAGVHRIGLDLADVVVNALEEKIVRLRNPNWNRPRPPPIPRGLNVLGMVMRAYQEIQRAQRAKAAADAARAAAEAAKAKKTPPPTQRPAPPPSVPPSPPARPRQPPPPYQQPSMRPQPPAQAYVPHPPGPAKRPPKPDFISNFIQKTRQQRQPPPAPKLFPKPPITKTPPYMKPEPRPEPVDPFLKQPSFRPIPKQGAFRPPSNIPTPPKINWNPKPKTSGPLAKVATATEKRASAMPLASEGPTASVSSYKPPSAVAAEPQAPKPHIKPAPMKIPKANIPPAPKRSEPPRPMMSLFPKRNQGRPSDIPERIIGSASTAGEKPVIKSGPIIVTQPPTDPTPSPQEKQLFQRYPGLFDNKVSSGEAARPQTPKRKAVAPSATFPKPSLVQIEPAMPVTQMKPKPANPPPVQAAKKVEPKISRPSKVWSPLGNLGSNINEILKFSIGGPSESVPIPTARPPPKPTTAAPTTTKAPVKPEPKKPKRVKKVRKANRRKKVVSKMPAKSKAVAISAIEPKSKTAKPSGTDKLTQLQGLLEGISHSQLQTLVDLIKAKANEGKPKPTPKPEVLPKPKPIFIPPPPGSQNTGPSREVRNMSPQGIPTGPQGSREGPFGPDRYFGPQNNGGVPPPWARGPGGPPAGPGGPPGGMRGGPPGGMRGGPPGGLDLNNPQVARLIRVLSRPAPSMLSGRSGGGGANAAAGGEAPEAGEGPTGLLGNPLMMSMLMNNQGGQGGAGGLAALLGNGGAGAGGNPLAALLGGGAAGGGGGQMDIMSMLAANGGAGAAAGGQAGDPMAMLQGLGGMSGAGAGAGAGVDAGMNPAMLAALMGNGQGGGADFLTSGGMGALGGGLGGMFAGLGM